MKGMVLKKNFLVFLFLMCCHSFLMFAQIEPEDVVAKTDDFENFFFESIKQKGMDNYDTALEALDKCANLQPKNAVVFYEMGKNYLLQKNYKNAFEMHKQFVIMRDSVFSSQTKKAAIKSQLRYDFEKKAAADSVKVMEEKKITDLQLKQEETTRYGLYIGLALVIIFAGFMFNRFKITQRQRNIISQQKHIVEEKQKEIDTLYGEKKVFNDQYQPIRDALDKQNEFVNKLKEDGLQLK